MNFREYVTEAVAITTMKQVTDKLGHRGERPEREIIAYLKRTKMNDGLMADVLGFYGIDGEDYFDEHGNWKTNKK